MATVPRVTAPTQDLQPLRDTPVGASVQVTAADTGGIEAAQEQQLGRSTSEAGLAAANIGARMQEADDAAAVLDAEAKLKTFTIDQQTRAQEMRGKDALGSTQAMAAEWDKVAGEIDSKMSTDRQRQMFRMRNGGTRAAHIGTLSRHEAAQRNEYMKDSVTANVQASIDLVAANPYNVEQAALEKANIVTQIQYLGKHLGWSSQQTTQAVMQQLTNLHKNVIQQLAVTDPSAAEGYYKANQDEIKGAERAEIGAFAEKATAQAKGETAAEEVWISHGPKSDRDPIELDKLEDAVRKKFPPEQAAARDAALRAVKERANAARTGRVERDNAREASVNQMILDGRGMSQIRSTPEFLSLSGESQRKIVDYLDNKALRDEQRLAARESRQWTREQRELARLERDGLATTIAMTDPDQLMRLTRNEVINLVPAIGPHNTKSLLAQWDSYSQNQARLGQARIESATFREVAAEYGYNVDKAKKGGSDAVQYLQLHSDVNRAVAAESQIKKAPLTLEEQRAVMHRVMSDTVLQSRWWWTDKVVPASMLTPDQLKDASVEVGGQKVKLATIPPDHAAAIARRLRAAGLPVTHQAIAERYIAAQKASSKPTSGVPE